MKLTSQNRGRGARAVAVRAVPRSDGYSDEGVMAVSRGGEIGERGGGGGGGSWFAQVRGARRAVWWKTKRTHLLVGVIAPNCYYMSQISVKKTSITRFKIKTFNP